MGLQEIIPAISLIAVLILILPTFLKTNSKSKQFLNNFSIWTVIVLVVMVVLYEFLK